MDIGKSEKEAIAKLKDFVEGLPPEKRKQFGDLHELKVLVERDPDARTVRIPEGMPLAIAAIFILEKMKAEEEKVEFSEEIDAFPLDAAHALFLAIQEQFGFHKLESKRGFWGDDPPVMISVATSHNESTQVPWGGFGLPGIEGRLETQATTNQHGRHVMIVCGSIKRKNHSDIMRLVARTRELLKERSLYRGKAISLTFGKNRQTGDIVPHTPSFMDVSRVDPTELILPDGVRLQVEANIYAPIQHRTACTKAGVPFRRGVLLAGNYGVGKTLTAHVLAKMATENSVTFLYCKDPERLKETLEFAQWFQPCVVFCEDIDRIAGEGRDDEANSLLNIVDGVDSKNKEVMLVLTTNKVGSITRALLRPGRIDSVIEVTPPDSRAAISLVVRYGRGLVQDTPELGTVGMKLAGQLPAVIREVVEKAKLGAIAENGGQELRDISPQALLTAAESMKTQLRLLSVPEPDIRSEVERAAAITAAGFVEGCRVLHDGGGNGADKSKAVTTAALAGGMDTIRLGATND